MNSTEESDVLKYIEVYGKARWNSADNEKLNGK
jgi:hypothetical protein